MFQKCKGVGNKNGGMKYIEFFAYRRTWVCNVVVIDAANASTVFTVLCGYHTLASLYFNLFVVSFKSVSVLLVGCIFDPLCKYNSAPHITDEYINPLEYSANKCSGSLFPDKTPQFVQRGYL